AVNKWIIGEVVETVAALDKALADLRFDAAANTIYHFVWDQFCDWYLELIKPGFVDGERQEMDAESKLVAGWVLDQILVMLHPFMPFITEELWHALSDPAHPRENDLIVAKWPAPGVGVDAEAKAEVEWVIDLIKSIRTSRVDLNIPPSVKLDIMITRLSDWSAGAYFANNQAIRRLARIDRVTVIKSVQGLSFSSDGDLNEGYNALIEWQEAGQFSQDAAMQIVAEDFLAFARLEGVIDIAAEKARLTKALEAVRKEAKSLEARLGNPAFVEKAKPEAIDKARSDFAEKSAEAERLGAALARLG
ncbi:MAG: class I tRNA ligase family protein, partial [Chloroflexota bacterium]